MCGASDNEEEHPESDGERESETYVPEPFPEKEFEPHGWSDILATIDVCTNEVTPTMFCDEEGYNLFPFQMVKVLQPIEEDAKEEDLEEWFKMKYLLLTIPLLTNLRMMSTTTRQKSSEKRTQMRNKGKLTRLWP